MIKAKNVTTVVTFQRRLARMASPIAALVQRLRELKSLDVARQWIGFSLNRPFFLGHSHGLSYRKSDRRRIGFLLHRSLFLGDSHFAGLLVAWRVLATVAFLG